MMRWVQLCGECSGDRYVVDGLCIDCKRAYDKQAVLNGDIPTYNDDNECRLCGEHISDPHHPDCELSKEAVA